MGKSTILPEGSRCCFWRVDDVDGLERRRIYTSLDSLNVVFHQMHKPSPNVVTILMGGLNHAQMFKWYFMVGLPTLHDFDEKKPRCFLWYRVFSPLLIDFLRGTLLPPTSISLMAVPLMYFDFSAVSPLKRIFIKLHPTKHWFKKMSTCFGGTFNSFDQDFLVSLGDDKATAGRDGLFMRYSKLLDGFVENWWVDDGTL